MLEAMTNQSHDAAAGNSPLPRNATGRAAGWSRRRRLRACPDCDLVVALPPLRPHERADCPRCGHVLVRRHRLPVQRGLAYAVTALIFLAMAVLFPFIGFDVRGIGNTITLTETGSALARYGEPLVAAAVLLGIVILPLAWIAGFIILHTRILRAAVGPPDEFLARALSHIGPWIMADVFLVALLVSLTKISGMATLDIGPAFWAYCAFVLVMVKAQLALDTDWLWFRLAGEPPAPPGIRPGTNAREQDMTGCHVCGLINPVDASGRGHCARCGDRVHTRAPRSLQNTLALLLLAILLYIPANTLPITHTTRFGGEQGSTIIGGVVGFVQAGDIPIAIVIFAASVLVPIGKMLALAWLCLWARRPDLRDPLAGARMYRLVDFIGRWSMVDVFVVAILVALVRAESLMSIVPGPAALAFAAMVITSMIAAMRFDPRLLWETPSPAQRSGHD
ncbi:paraquat-inducible protein A [Halofilum ochraceum]|uniref:paraquat-inducible protein A n=1 Tax=Halofilum ochraceum TaxID=1611323 RepID=UPI001C2F11E2